MSAYPRPQMERNEWLCLDGAWKFIFDDERRFRRPQDIVEWTREILVPYPPESRASGIGDRGLHRACWYERKFHLAAKSRPERVLLHFGAVDYFAMVWVNGHHVISHEGGHTPFAVDITSAINGQREHTVTVMAEDDPHDLEKPRGKQDWQLEPHSLWYPRTTGIWQTVWIECVSATYIGKLRWTPHLHEFAIELEAMIGGEQTSDLSLDVVLRSNDRILISDSYQVLDRALTRRLILSDPGIDDFRNELLWSPEHPTLLEANLTLKHGTEVIDQVKSYTALRSVSISRDRFLLNGRPYMLRMVLDQGYWPDTLLAAPNDDALRMDVELAKAMGFNGVRKHQKIENPRYLYWADRLGLVVWEEMPSAYRFTRAAIQRTVREWAEAIERDYSHPCIVVWVPFNESWGVPDLPSVSAHQNAVQALYHLTKTLDPTRPVIGNDGWESTATDIIGIHDYDDSPERIAQRYGGDTTHLFDRRRPGGRVLTLDGYPHRGQPIVLTEFGGISAIDKNQTIENAWGYSTAQSPEELATRYAKLMNVMADTPLFSGFCYTQFTDTFQETNGLLFADRRPKIPLDELSRLTRTSRTSIPGGI